eukprot:CAMPEP_0201525140 /NCGR_PEP_ID=MMETSP0161_2-20130828/26912_1 /ASSEMBLY_ACC=CAM_ASM_000251 /TAXON_ID=180227 /ORGANISM="Neoparamoeba aestuarina, Strain SoJaBio B1-5/56/2" /LENGTH=54 /DNA_ID=CAMNT_0047924925 /DNA_START=198 /DNA_END=362 /DNA_ORIENTATION=+
MAQPPPTIPQNEVKRVELEDENEVEMGGDNRKENNHLSGVRGRLVELEDEDEME